VGSRTLRIAVDGRELLGQPTGVGRYLRGILDAWNETPFQHELTIVAPGPAPRGLPSLGGRVHWHAIPARTGGTGWEQVTLGRAIGRLRPDVFFGAGYTAPLRLACPSVLAVYDVSFFAHPEWFPTRQGWRRRTLPRASARRAHSVVTISEFSAGEITTYLGVPRPAIHVAPPGAPDVSTMRPARSSSREPLVLYVGSIFERRQIPLLIEAFARTASSVPDARLVLAGDNRTTPPISPSNIAHAFGVGDRVDWRAYVTDAELAELYGRARAFAFLSDYEGFGLTPLEALAHGVPSVLLDTPVAREIYDGSALIVSRQVDAVGDALSRLLTDDQKHAQVVESGQARMARFSWRESATRILRALEQAAGTGNG